MPNTTAPNAKWLWSAVLAHLLPEKKERATRQWPRLSAQRTSLMNSAQRGLTKKAGLSHLSRGGRCGAWAGSGLLGGLQGFTTSYSPAYRQFLWAHMWGQIECAHPDLLSKQSMWICGIFFKNDVGIHKAGWQPGKWICMLCKQPGCNHTHISSEQWSTWRLWKL